MTPIHATPPDTPDPDALDAATYHAVVGPALRAAAEVAAHRGHPTLQDDMPSMLGLIELIEQLGALYTEAYPKSADAHQLAGAPWAACVMVFREAGLPVDDMRICLAALISAHQRVRDETVIGDPRPGLAMAWSFIEDGKRGEGQRRLQRTLQMIAANIDDWEQRREP